MNFDLNPITGKLDLVGDPATAKSYYYNVEDYGAKHDGNTDDTAAIQAAINACYAAGGGTVFFPNGIYVLSGALQTNVNGLNYNSQLYIPYYGGGAGGPQNRGRVSILLLGESVPVLMQSCGISTAYTPNTGVILKSTIQGSGANPSIISSGIASGGTISQNNDTETHIKNLQFQPVVDSNNRITIGAINFRRSRNAIIKNTSCFPFEINLVNSSTPINNCCGIQMPTINCEHINFVENCNVGGFESGIVSGEHTCLINTVTISCLYGYVFLETNHIITGYSLKSFWCANNVRFTGISYVKIDSLQVEWDDLGKWYDTQYTILDPNNYGRGEIGYNIVEADVGFNNSRFSQSGGLNLKISAIINEQGILTLNSSYLGDTLNARVDTNAIGFGALLAQGADFNFDEADADSISTCKMLGIALQSGTGIKKILLKGQVCNTAWNWSPGAIYASTTQGNLTQTAPTGTDKVVVIVGWALSADTIYFNPYGSFLELN